MCLVLEAIVVRPNGSKAFCGDSGLYIMEYEMSVLRIFKMRLFGSNSHCLWDSVHLPIDRMSFAILRWACLEEGQNSPDVINQLYFVKNDFIFKLSLKLYLSNLREVHP